MGVGSREAKLKKLWPLAREARSKSCFFRALTSWSQCEAASEPLNCCGGTHVI